MKHQKKSENLKFNSKIGFRVCSFCKPCSADFDRRRLFWGILTRLSFHIDTPYLPSPSTATLLLDHCATFATPCLLSTLLNHLHSFSYTSHLFFQPSIRIVYPKPVEITKLIKRQKCSEPPCSAQELFGLKMFFFNSTLWDSLPLPYFLAQFQDKDYLIASKSLSERNFLPKLHQSSHHFWHR